MEDKFQFHDGFELKKGDRILIPALAIQMDPENYKDPDKFDGYRFVHYSGGKPDNPQSLVSAAAVDPKFLQSVQFIF